MSRKIFKITIEDETHLDKLAETRVGYAEVIVWASAVIALMLVAALSLVIFTPLNRLVPGSLNEHQRILTQQAIMRVDSLSETVAHTREWIDNYTRVTDTRRTAGDSVAYSVQQVVYNADSIPGASSLERSFVSSMEERERFNISVLAPLDADGMAFVAVAPQAVMTRDSRQSKEAMFLLPDAGPVQTIADGTVLAVYPNATLKGFTVLVQHGRGFVSSYSHLGNPLVSAGDAVNGGQSIAFPPNPDSRNSRWIMVRIWHNGSQIMPADIIPEEP